MHIFGSSLISAVVAAILAMTPALAQDAPVWHHGTALIGEPKYPEGFDHFDYVNPDAPKGGTVRLSETGTFDTLNPILAKGDTATGLALVHESLMMSPLDETSVGYGLLAEAVSYPDDISSATFRLRENARWHDGEPVTPEDVVWSFEKAVELDPQRMFYYKHVTGAEVSGPREVTFTFDETNNRELPQIVGQLVVAPKHWWEGTDANGKARDISATTLEPPLGSGPYRISKVDPGSSITFERVPDYWGKDLNVNIGKNNFDTISYTYFTDRNVEFEAFKGDVFDFWSENEAKRWATSYNFPAVNDGRIKRERYDNPYRATGVWVGFIPNLRREKFQDERVRRALNYAFDFEELQRTIFFGEYVRVDSYFDGTELAATGLPEGKELEILESVRDMVPESVFTTPYENPVGGTPEKLRSNLREAVRLFREAGYEIRDNRMVDTKTGEQFSFEIMLNGPIIERVALPWSQNLKRIGVNATVRSIDSTQFVNRWRSRDYDVFYGSWAQSLSPGNEQAEYWGSESATRAGSANYAGIADPGVDALIRKVIFAKDREELVAATHALDRVLLAHNYTIPTYRAGDMRIAYWDRFSHPDELPEYSIGFPTIWWAKSAEN